MDKRRLYDINKECSGNRMILNKRLKEDEHQSLTISYEEFGESYLEVRASTAGQTKNGIPV